MSVEPLKYMMTILTEGAWSGYDVPVVVLLKATQFVSYQNHSSTTRREKTVSHSEAVISKFFQRWG